MPAYEPLQHFSWQKTAIAFFSASQVHGGPSAARTGVSGADRNYNVWSTAA